MGRGGGARRAATLRDVTTPFPFVVGCPRSGTTLLRAMLDSHPELAVPGESYFIVELAPRFGPRWYRRFNRAGCLDALLAHPRFEHWELDAATVRDAVTAAAPRDYPALLRVLYGEYARAQGKPRYGDKTPNYVLDLPVLASLFPEARFVHVVRDGRDVALSVTEIEEWGPAKVEGAARYWVRHVEAGRAAGDALGAERYLEVRYDALVDDPEATLRTVCAFVDLPFARSMLTYPDRFDALVSSNLQPEIHERLRRPPTKGLRSWRDEMSRDEIATFEAIAGAALEKFGFDVVTA
jgi:sulfotransferase family protein